MISSTLLKQKIVNLSPNEWRKVPERKLSYISDDFGSVKGALKQKLSKIGNWVNFNKLLTKQSGNQEVSL